MLPNRLQTKAAERLAELIRKNNHQLATGFLGTPYLLHVLAKYGYTDIAYKLLMQKECPSWLYPVSQGATTIWEKWNAIMTGGEIQQASFNHYAYGAEGDWLFGNVAGISAIEPGFRKIQFAPQPGGGLTWAKAAYSTSFGTIKSQWKIKRGRFVLTVTVPPGNSAIIKLPGGEYKNAGLGKHTFTSHLD